MVEWTGMEWNGVVGVSDLKFQGGCMTTFRLLYGHVCRRVNLNHEFHAIKVSQLEKMYSGHSHDQWLCVSAASA